MAYCVHYGSSQFYVAVCAPAGVAGFLYGLVSVASPVCSTALSTVAHTQNLYSNFVVFGISRMVVEMIERNKEQ